MYFKNIYINTWKELAYQGSYLWYLTIIPRVRVGYDMVASQRGA